MLKKKEVIYYDRKTEEVPQRLAELMKKHDIESMIPKGTYIHFFGEDESIAVGAYEGGEFKHILQTIHSYKP